MAGCSQGSDCSRSPRRSRVAFAGGGDDPQRKAPAEERAAAPRRDSEQSSGQKPARSPAPSAPAQQQQPGAGPGGAGTGADAGASAEQLNDRGYALLQRGQAAAAIPLLQQAVERGSGLTQAYAMYNLGRALRLAGRPAEAIPILERRARIPNQQDTVKRELKAAKRAAGRSGR